MPEPIKSRRAPRGRPVPKVADPAPAAKAGPPTDLGVLIAIKDLLLIEHPSLAAFLRQVLLHVRALVGGDRGFIGVVTADGHRAAVRDETDRLIGAEFGDWRVPVSSHVIGGSSLSEVARSFCGYAAYTRRSRMSPDVHRLRYYMSTGEGTRSEIAVPVLVRGHVVAVINLESNRRGFYRLHHMQTLELVARLIAPHVDNLLAREGLQASVLGRVLRQIDDVLRADSGRTLETVCQLAAEALVSRMASLWLVNRKTGELALGGVWARSGRRKRGPFDRERQSVHRVLEDARPLQSRGSLYVPLLADGVLGVLAVGTREFGAPSKFYTVEDEQTLTVIAARIASAVHLKDLVRQRADEFRERSRKLTDLAGVFRELDLKALMQRAVDQLPDLCGGTGASLFMWEEAKQRFMLQASTCADIEKAGYQPREGLTGWVAATGRMLVLSQRTPGELMRHDRELTWRHKCNDARRSTKELEHRPFLAVPIFLRNQPVGVIRIADRVDDSPFNEADIAIVALVANYIGSAYAYFDKIRVKLQWEGHLRQLRELPLEPDRHELGTIECERGLMQRIVEIIARGWQADIVTLYTATTRSGTQNLRGPDLLTPPIWTGELRSGTEVMQQAIYPDDIPDVILTNGSSYWSSTDSAKLLTDRVPARDGRPERMRFAAREGIKSSAGIRLDVLGRPVGVLFLNFRRQFTFYPEARDVLQVYANQVAVTLEIVRLHKQIREAGQRHLAREIHDGIANPLAAHVEIGAAKASDIAHDLALKYGVRVAALMDELDVIREACRYVRDQAREMIGELHEPTLERAGLATALRDYFRSAPPSLSVDVVVEGAPRPAPHIEWNLYRIAQEAYHNAVKHAQAQHFWIVVQFQPHEALMTVGDDGIGFDASIARDLPTKFGLRGIEERVRLLGGRCDIASSTGEAAPSGTTLSIRLPMGHA